MGFFDSFLGGGLGNLFGNTIGGSAFGWGGGGGGGYNGNPAYIGMDPSIMASYFGSLPTHSYGLQGIGLSGTAAGGGLESLFGIKATQLGDFLSSQQLQQQLTPLQAQTDMQLAGQLIPQQMMQQNAFQGLEYGLLGQNPAFAAQQQNFQAGQAGAFGMGQLLPGIQNNVMGLQGGINSLLSGGLPQGLSTQIQDSLLSNATAFGLDQSPVGLMDVNQAMGTSLAGIQSSLLGSYAGASQSLMGQGQGVLSSLFGASNQMAPGFGSLLANTGVPDIGFGPIGFGNAADIYGKKLQQDQQANQNKKNTNMAYAGMASSFLGNILGGGFGGGYF